MTEVVPECLDQTLVARHDDETWFRSQFFGKQRRQIMFEARLAIVFVFACSRQILSGGRAAQRENDQFAGFSRGLQWCAKPRRRVVGFSHAKADAGYGGTCDDNDQDDIPALHIRNSRRCLRKPAQVRLCAAPRRTSPARVRESEGGGTKNRDVSVPASLRLDSLIDAMGELPGVISRDDAIMIETCALQI